MRMMRKMRDKLQKILNKLDGTNEKTAQSIREFKDGVKSLHDKLQQEIQVATLEEVNLKLNKFRKSVDLTPLFASLEDLAKNFEESVSSLLGEIEHKSAELQDLTLRGDKTLEARVNE